MKKLLLVLVLSPSAVGRAQETVTLTAPITRQSVTAFQLTKITIDLANRSIYVEWTGNNNEPFSASYPTPVPSDHPSQPTGAALIHTINSMNFTTTSMAKRFYQQLQNDNYIGAGSISGSAQ